MEADRWERVAELFDLASEQSVDERHAFLAEACKGDEELKREVESLLSQDVSQHGPLERISEHVERPWAFPASIGRYRILSLIGEGGMGVVYEAEQDHPRRTVALKVIKSALAGPELLRRFARESEALGRLQHPGIARIYEADAAETHVGPQPYLVMELIRGLPLLAYANTERLNLRQRLELMIKVCEAVDHAHQRGIIHRDLKPGNILVDETGQPKILDFGVARITDSDATATRQTSLGELVGTLAYMSPEQTLADPSQLDARSDIYSLGVILYELLAQRLPYEISKQLAEAARAVREEDPRPLGTINRVYRGDIETVLTKALEKDRTRRYSSAEELAMDLRRFLADEPIRARPPSLVYQTRKFAHRHRTLVSAAAAVFLVLIAGVMVSTLQAIRANRERDRAVGETKRADREAAVAKAVNDFLRNDILGQANARVQGSPNTKPDPNLSVSVALDRAAARIAGKFDTQPLVEAAIRKSMGSAYRDMGFLAKAQAQLEQAVDLTRRALGPDHADTLDSMEELEVLYNYQGKYAPAEALATKILEVRRRVLGRDHKDTLGAMHNLAFVYSNQGDRTRAAALMAEVLEGERRVQGDENRDTLTVMHNLATQYRALGKFPEAERLLKKALELRRKVLGPAHPSTLGSMYALGMTYVSEGKFDEAESLLTEASETRRQTLGEENWETIISQNGIGILYRAEGKYAEAESILTRTLEARRRVMGVEHPDTLGVMSDLAEVYRRKGQAAKAESIFRQVLEARRRVLGPDHPGTADVLATLGELKLAQHDYLQAEKLLREAVQAREKRSPDSWERYYAQSMLGATFAALGKHAEAEQLLTSGFKGMLERRNCIPAENRDALQRVSQWVAQLNN